MKVATLLEPDLAATAAAIRNFDPHADAFEVRFDAFERPPEPSEIRPLTRKPLIATCRRPADGGLYHGEENERLAILEGAAEAGFDHIDVEGPVQLPVPETRMIRSLHDFRATPPTGELVRRAEGLVRAGAHAKIATQVHTFDDTLHLLAALHQLRQRKIAASLMGLGDFPRALAHLLGSEFVYGGARTNAAGQPPLKDIWQTLRLWGDPNPAKDLFLVIGTPIGHSLSPRIHNAAFQTANLDACYGALEVESQAELQLLLERSAELGLKGLSVTAPLKEAAYRHVEDTTPEAAKAKSVNCIKIEGDRARGHNTDGVGAERVLKRLLGKREGRPRVLVVGTGGAARGLLGEAKDMELIVAGRNPQKLRGIENEFEVGTVPLERCPQYFPTYDAVVNATTVEAPLRLDGFTGAVFDFHYGSEPTAWETDAKARGLAFAGGFDLLLEQALPAFEFWTGRPAPREAMKKALETTP